jgi:hypothetical protein
MRGVIEVQGMRRTAAAESLASSQRPWSSSMRAVGEQVEPIALQTSIAAVVEPRLQVAGREAVAAGPDRRCDEHDVRSPDMLGEPGSLREREALLELLLPPSLNSQVPIVASAWTVISVSSRRSASSSARPAQRTASSDRAAAEDVDARFE